jgi:hypothetical protein
LERSLANPLRHFVTHFVAQSSLLALTAEANRFPKYVSFPSLSATTMSSILAASRLEDLEQTSRNKPPFFLSRIEFKLLLIAGVACIR